jgi:high-affinity iron transporter
VAVLGAFVAWILTPAPAPAPPTPRGREQYEPNCAQCHGADGPGDGPQASAWRCPPADFKLHVPFYTDLFFFQVITRGFGVVVPAFGDQISEEGRWNLINFLLGDSCWR